MMGKIIPVPETASLSETALAEDWYRPEEDEAWMYLQDAAQSSLKFWDNSIDDEDWNNA